jgi:hypothetical protein
MPYYKIEFSHTQYSHGEKSIEAKSKEAAGELAEEISSDELETEVVDGSLDVVSIIKVKAPKKVQTPHGT